MNSPKKPCILLHHGMDVSVQDVRTLELFTFRTRARALAWAAGAGYEVRTQYADARRQEVR